MAITRGWLIRKAPGFASIISILIVMHGWFYVASTPASKAVRDLVTLAYPFATFVSTIMLCRFQYMNFKRRVHAWQHVFVYFAGLIIFLIMGLAIGYKSSTYVYYYDIFGGKPLGAAGAMFCWTFVLAVCSTFIARNWGYSLMTAMMALSLFGAGLLAEMTFPFLTDIFTWVQDNIAMSGNQSIWICVYIGFAAIIMRVISLKQSLGGLE